MAAAGAACAACKYQRRRCAADCPLAQFFPHDQPRVFHNARRLFGVSNILKTLDRAGPDPDRRREAMQCVVYESQAWDLYPSAGCVPIILALQQRVRQAEHELRRVHADLQACRRRGRAAAQPPVRCPDDNNLDYGGAGVHCSAEAMPSSSSSIPPAPFMYGGGGGGGGEQQQMMAMVIDNAVTSDDGDIAAVAPMRPWTIQPPQYEQHPSFVSATTMVPQFHYQQQPNAVSTKLPELQDDMMNYFAGGVNGGNDETTPRESSTDSSGEKAMRTQRTKMKDNNGFIKQDVASSSTLLAAANKS